MSEHEHPMPGQQLGLLECWKGYDSQVQAVDDLDEANIITSKVKRTVLDFEPMHKVLIDVDLPAQLLPSSTPGHFHLYIDKPINWVDYVDLLRALERCGIVEPGYVSASIDRGFTSLRLPWIKKSDPSPALRKWAS